MSVLHIFHKKSPHIPLLRLLKAFARLNPDRPDVPAIIFPTLLFRRSTFLLSFSSAASSRLYFVFVPLSDLESLEHEEIFK